MIIYICNWVWQIQEGLAEIWWNRWGFWLSGTDNCWGKHCLWATSSNMEDEGHSPPGNGQRCQSVPWFFSSSRSHALLGPESKKLIAIAQLFKLHWHKVGQVSPWSCSVVGRILRWILGQWYFILLHPWPCRRPGVCAGSSADLSKQFKLIIVEVEADWEPWHPFFSSWMACLCNDYDQCWWGGWSLFGMTNLRNAFWAAARQLTLKD